MAQGSAIRNDNICTRTLTHGNIGKWYDIKLHVPAWHLAQQPALNCKGCSGMETRTIAKDQAAVNAEIHQPHIAQLVYQLLQLNPIMCALCRNPCDA